MTTGTETRPGIEVRAAPGRRLVGVVMKYGDVSPDFREKFARFAFADRRGGFGDVLLNVQHSRARLIARTGGGGLELRDAPDALRMLATLDRTRDADDALRMVGRGLLRGLSVEFRALLDRHTADGLRVVQRARLSGIGVVDVPSYPAADVAVRCLELRRGGRAIAGVFRYGQRRTVSDRGTGKSKPRKREYRRLMTDSKAAVLAAYQARIFSVAFDADASPADVQRVADEMAEGARGDARERARRAYSEVEDPAGVPEIQLTAGRSYDRPVASMLAGSLRVAEAPGVGLRFVARLPDRGTVPYADELIAQHDQGLAILGVDPLGVVPPPEVSPGAVELVPEIDGAVELVEVVNDFNLRALALVARPIKGLNDPELQVLTGRGSAPRRRSRPWL